MSTTPPPPLPPPSQTTVGWFKSSLSGEFWNGVEQYQWLASTDSGEVVLPPYSTSGRNDTTSISDDAVTTSNAHTEATAVAAVSSVLTLALVGTHRLFKKKKPASPLVCIAFTLPLYHYTTDYTTMSLYH
mmetsp:Transcript_23114/g.61710  ORF Transcript_23114/g.61710 Transcript_23114/m.61710 type:complete len:130 (+) Transcript_23114:824-1213(+)